jgi:ATP-dependent Lon protease
MTTPETKQTEVLSSLVGRKARITMAREGEELELGDEEERDDIEEMRDRIEELELTEDQRLEINRELRRLERTSPQSAEYQVIRTFLEWITELPWNERTEEKIDLEKAETILEEDHYGLEDIKDRILEFLAVRKLQLDRMSEKDGEHEAETDEEMSGSESENEESELAPEEALPGRGPILLFVGPPGVGKTSIAQSIARSLGRNYVRISLGGARDEARSSHFLRTRAAMGKNR